ncbi:MAG: glycoside hydrolase family 16 protein [Deltaproteobacteria bacterium]|nr:glycoside hydrolase family 16 protein [Deltaproteobacteria bacterium]
MTVTVHRTSYISSTARLLLFLALVVGCSTDSFSVKIDDICVRSASGENLKELIINTTGNTPLITRNLGCGADQFSVNTETEVYITPKNEMKRQQLTVLSIVYEPQQEIIALIPPDFELKDDATYLVTVDLPFGYSIDRKFRYSPGDCADTDTDEDTTPGTANKETGDDSTTETINDTEDTVTNQTDTMSDKDTTSVASPDTDADSETDTDSDTETTGILSIIALKEADYNVEYTSGRLNSNFEVPNEAGTFVEARLKLVLGRCSEANRYVNGSWVAFWLLGSNSDEQGYGGTVPWPECGEIVMVQWIGAYGDTYFTTNQSGSPAFDVDHNVQSYINFTTGPEHWHTYGVRFNGDTITFTFDGENMSTKIYNDAEDHTHRILLNMAVGGVLGGIVDENLIQDMLQVDWVRVTDADGELLWADEMNSETFTRANWFPHVGKAYNNELQYYTNWESDNFQWHGDFSLGECD